MGEKPCEGNQWEEAVKCSLASLQHDRTDTGKKICDCKECDKATRNKTSQLILHQKTDSGGKPCECTERGKAFSVSFPP